MSEPIAKARVYKGPLGWNWRHACPGRRGAVDMGFRSWGAAYAVALRHAKRCTA